MPEEISRRAFHKRALVAGLGAALAADGLAQKQKATPADPDVSALEAKLEKPLPSKLKSPAKAALKNLKTASAERLKFKLPEGSEPCTTFVPNPARSREP
ncbi:MAG TPA: twin-arginine translocation signal domain-containing protein [Fimbriimonadaceae bacterium]|nr:twin-arginine translocation signal domain-containing protein [Fimbriimonadaceae bacterium]